jgi:hypothetical protein
VRYIVPSSVKHCGVINISLMKINLNLTKNPGSPGLLTFIRTQNYLGYDTQVLFRGFCIH